MIKSEVRAHPCPFSGGVEITSGEEGLDEDIYLGPLLHLPHFHVLAAQISR